jgi:hypothetical protein
MSISQSSVLPRTYRRGFDRISLSELVVDFFGSLVPGLIFTFSIIVLFGLPLFSLLAILSRLLDGEDYPDAVALLTTVGTLLNPYWLEVLLFTLVVAFVAGHFFYRQDPKLPDSKSFKRIKPALQEDIQKQSWVILDAKDCEFPYKNLYGYLTHRGLEHLAQFVPWRQDTPATAKKTIHRTKNFINILKIRLAFHFPEKCGAIARNEAHIRLMSSTWYMARALGYASLGALFVAATSLGLAWLEMSGGYEIRPIVHVLPVILPLIGLFLARYSTISVERFLHYQRVREIIFVLETAYTAFRDQPKIIQDLCPDFGAVAPVPEERAAEGEAEVVQFPEGATIGAAAPPAEAAGPSVE